MSELLETDALGQRRMESSGLVVRVLLKRASQGLGGSSVRLLRITRVENGGRWPA